MDERVDHRMEFQRSPTASEACVLLNLRSRTQSREGLAHMSLVALEVALHRHGILGRRFATENTVTEAMIVEHRTIVAAGIGSAARLTRHEQEDTRLANEASALSAGG